MTTKTLRLFVFSLFALASFACSKSNVKPTYEKPKLENGDYVLVRGYKTEFRKAQVCATKTTGASSDRFCSGQVGLESAKNLKEDQVMIVGCDVGMPKSAPVETDETILIGTSKNNTPNLQPPAEPGDIVIVRGTSTKNDNGCYPPGDGFGDLFPAVKVVNVFEGKELYFSFLSKDREEYYTQSTGRFFSDFSEQKGVYRTNEWYVPSPKLTEILKQP